MRNLYNPAIKAPNFFHIFMIIVSGGAGFIGSNFVLDWCEHSEEPVLVVDCLTYAGNLENLQAVSRDGSFDGQVLFSRTDLCDLSALEQLTRKYEPRAIVHFAAESHVDRSIHGPGAFLQTNVMGTFNLCRWLEICIRYMETVLDSCMFPLMRFMVH